MIKKLANAFLLGHIPAMQQAAYDAAEREKWLHSCVTLGANRAALLRLDAEIVAYAATTPTPNHVTIEILRRTIQDELRAARPLPETAEAAMQAARREALRRTFDL